MFNNDIICSLDFTAFVINELQCWRQRRTRTRKNRIENNEVEERKVDEGIEVQEKEKQEE